MKRKKIKKVRITERDMEFFKYLYSFKIATLRQIKRDIFPHCSRESMSRRINRLVRENLITTTALGRMKTFKGYSITEKTFDRFLRYNFAGITRRQFQSNYPLHDIGLLDIRYSFLQKKSVKEYIPENLLQSGADFLQESDGKHLIKHHPDGLVKVEVDKNLYTFCLEYDAHVKTKPRYGEFLNKYYLDKNVTAVFFIYKEVSLFQSLFSLEQKLFTRMTPRIYYCSLDDFMNMREETTFINRKKVKLKIE